MSGKILIVEDNADSRNYLAALLEIKGYTVSTAADGVEGIEVAKTDSPDIIISDLTMPNLDGIQMMRTLRETPRFKKIPVVVMSAYGSGQLSEAARMGADFIMRKPLNCDLLFETIERLLA